MPVAPQRVVLPPQISSVTLNPSSVTGGTAQVIGKVTLNQPAPAGGVAVIFRSSNPAVAAVPPGVTVQPGATSATFIVQPQPVATNPNVVTGPPSVQISAQAGNSSPVIAQLTVLPPTIASLTLNPATVAGSNPSTGQVTITGPAPPGGLEITLSAAKRDSGQQRGPSGDVLRTPPAPVTVPSQVFIPAGAASASFPITTRPVSTTTPVEIRASRGVFVTKTATLTVLPPGISSVTLSPTKDPVGGASLTGTVTMDAPASAEGATVTLSISDTHTYTTCGPAPVVPANVQFVAGSTSATFPVTTSPGTGRYRLSASLSGSSKSVDMFVREALINSDSLVFTQSVKGGTIVQASLELIGVASTCGSGGKYKLQSSDTNLAQVPPEVTVAPGSSVGTFQITTSAVPSPRTVDISVLGNVGYGLVWLKKTLTLTP